MVILRIAEDFLDYLQNAIESIKGTNAALFLENTYQDLSTLNCSQVNLRKSHEVGTL